MSGVPSVWGNIRCKTGITDISRPACVTDRTSRSIHPEKMAESTIFPVRLLTGTGADDWSADCFFFNERLLSIRTGDVRRMVDAGRADLARWRLLLRRERPPRPGLCLPVDGCRGAPAPPMAHPPRLW